MTAYSFKRSTALAPIALVLAISAAMPITVAAAPTGAAHAYDLSVNINVVAVGSLIVNPQAEVQHLAQTAGWSDADQVLSFDSGAGPLRLTTGELHAVSQWSPGSTFHAIGSQASAANVNLSAIGLLSASLLSVQAQQITATSIIAGSCPPSGGRPSTAPSTESLAPVDDIGFSNGFDIGSLKPGGTSENSGLGISALGTNVPGLPGQPPPNTTIDLPGLGILGVTLILNEQVVGGDGVNSLTLSTNGLHLTMNVVGVITANVIIAHADAALVCP